MAGRDSDYKIIGFFEETGRGMTLDPDVEVVFGSVEEPAEPGRTMDQEEPPAAGRAH